MPPDRPTFVVIGAGQAGGRAAEAMRAAGFAGRIVVVGAENHVPYERPPLSKRVLTGEDGPETTHLHDAAFYRENAIELRLGTRATAIDCAAKRVDLSDGDALAYDKLLIATGAAVRRLAVPGSELEGIHYLRTIEDSLAIRARLGADAGVVIVGGGYIGLEVAAAARSRGCRVTVLEMEDVPMSRVVAPEIGRFFADVHRERGVDVRTGVTVGGFEGSGRVERVVCRDGTVFLADVVAAGIGIIPDTALAEAAGLAVDDGIVVDAYGQTSDTSVFAAGDVANHPTPPAGRRVRLESWQNAQNQAIAVARAMCGTRAPYAEVPWVWSDQYDLNLQMVGVPERWDRLVFRGEVAQRAFSVFYLNEGAVVAANAVNAPRDVRYARKMIEEGSRVEPAALADRDVPLRTLLTG